jgi:hypothetical protein
VHPLYLLGVRQVLRRGAFRSFPPPSPFSRPCLNVHSYAFLRRGQVRGVRRHRRGGPGHPQHPRRYGRLRAPGVAAKRRLVLRQQRCAHACARAPHSQPSYPSPHWASRRDTLYVLWSIAPPRGGVSPIHLTASPVSPFMTSTCCVFAPPRGGVFQRGGGARQVAGPLRRRLEGPHRPRGGQTTRPRWVCSPSVLQCMCLACSPSFGGLGCVWGVGSGRASVVLRRGARRPAGAS